MKILSRLLGLLIRYRCYRVYERDVSGSMPQFAPPTGVSVRTGIPADIDRLTEQDLGYDSLKRDMAAQRLKDGNRFVLAEMDDRVVSILWVSESSIWSPTGLRDLGAGWAYLSDSSSAGVEGQYDINKSLVRHALDVSREMGMTKGVCFTYAGDEDGVRIHEELEFVSVGDVRRMRILKSFWCEFSRKGLFEYLASRAAIAR